MLITPKVQMPLLHHCGYLTGPVIIVILRTYTWEGLPIIFQIHLLLFPVFHIMDTSHKTLLGLPSTP